MFCVVTMVIGCESYISVTLENKTLDKIKWGEDGPHIPVDGQIGIGTLEDEEDENAFWISIFRSYGCVAEILITGVNFPEEDSGEVFKETVVLTEEPPGTLHAQAKNGYVTTQVRECIDY